jgi:xanthine permease
MNKDLINEKLPMGKNIAFAVQHVFVMVAGAVAVPLMIGKAADLTSNEVSFLISCALLVSGIATLLQSLGITKLIGSKLPIVEGPSFAPVSAMVAIVAGSAVKTQGLRELSAAVICAGLFCIILSGVWSKMLFLFPKVVTGTVVTVIGMSLFPVGIKWISNNQTEADPKAILLAALTLLIILLCNKFLKGVLGNLSVLFGLIGGTIIGVIMDPSIFAPVAEAKWFEIGMPFHVGMPIFNIGSIISIILTMIVIMTAATGNMIAISTAAGEEMDPKKLSAGLRSSGISSVLSGIFNCYPVAPFAQNVGMVSLTQVFSRFVTATAGIILLLLGVFPKFAAIFTAIPPAVLGGAGFAMFGIVAVDGIRTLGQVDYIGNRNGVIVAVSLGLSFISTVVPGFFNALPTNLATILNSGITIGSASAIILNVFFNILLKPKENK